MELALRWERQAAEELALDDRGSDCEESDGDDNSGSNGDDDEPDTDEDNSSGNGSGDDDSDKILDVLARPDYYADIVMDIRRDFRERHSPDARLRELIGYIEE